MSFPISVLKQFGSDALAKTSSTILFPIKLADAPVFAIPDGGGGENIDFTY